MEIGRGRDYKVNPIVVGGMEFQFQSPMEIGRGRDALFRDNANKANALAVSVSDGDWKRSRPPMRRTRLSSRRSTTCFSLRWRLEEVATRNLRKAAGGASGHVSVSDGDWKRSRLITQHEARHRADSEFQSPMEIGRGRDEYTTVMAALKAPEFQSPRDRCQYLH